jgi:hypothetical protein
MRVRYALRCNECSWQRKRHRRIRTADTKRVDKSFDAREQKSVNINFDHLVNFPCSVRRLTLSPVALIL